VKREGSNKDLAIFTKVFHAASRRQEREAPGIYFLSGGKPERFISTLNKLIENRGKQP